MTTREQMMAEAVRRAAPADPERLTADDFARIAREFETIREETATSPAQAGGQEPWRGYVEADSRSDQQIALSLLEAEGNTRAQALETLALDPSATERLAGPIRAARAADEEQREAVAQRAYAQSPEGLRGQAQALIAADQQRAELVTEGAALLQSRGEYEDGMPDEHVLKLSGLTPPDPDPATDLQANLAAANSDIAAGD